MWTGKVVVVTGAAGGIGRAICRRFLDARAIVYGLDRDDAGLQKLAFEAQKRGEEFFPLPADVTGEGALPRALSAVTERHVRVHVWINNAGVSGIGRFRASDAEAFARVVELNFGSLVRGTRLALEHMEQAGGGSIVNMASVAGFVPAPFLTAYSATKHAVVGFTRALQEELALEASPVHLMLVSPGFVNTKMIHGEEGTVPARPVFPEWLSWVTASPETVAKKLVSGLAAHRLEVNPTWNGKVMRTLHGIVPARTRRLSKILLTESPWDILWGRYNIK